MIKGSGGVGSIFSPHLRDVDGDGARRNNTIPQLGEQFSTAHRYAMSKHEGFAERNFV